jgi:hypothetical protein
MPLKTLAVVCVSATAALGATACGSSDDTATTPAKRATQPVSQLTSLSGKDTAIAFNRNFLTSLTTFKIKTATIGAGTSSGTVPIDNVVKLPITSGTLRYYTPGSVRQPVQGSIHLGGSGVSLTKGSTVVDLTNLVINPRTAVVTGTYTLNGKVRALKMPLFAIDSAKLHPLKVDTTTQTGSFPATPLTLRSGAARTLNRSFSTTGFTKGWLVGRATITVDTAMMG